MVEETNHGDARCKALGRLLNPGFYGHLYQVDRIGDASAERGGAGREQAREHVVSAASPYTSSAKARTTSEVQRPGAMQSSAMVRTAEPQVHTPAGESGRKISPVCGSRS